VNFEHIKRHYYQSHRSINPSGIVPVGPTLDFTSPHGREQRRAAPPAEPSAKEIEATRL
jgi:putative glutathione S-transferase